MKYYLYHFLDQNGTPFYVGVTKNLVLRKQRHLSLVKSNNKWYVYNKIRKLIEEFGYELDMQVIEVFETAEEAYNAEISKIKEYKQQGTKLYNLKPGGNGGYSRKMSEEEKKSREEQYRKHSEFMKGEHNPFRSLEQTPERRKMLSNKAKQTFKGTVQSEEHKRKRAEAYTKTCKNYTVEQKLAMSARNREKSRLQKIKQYKNYIIIYNKQTYKHLGNCTTLSKCLLNLLQLDIKPFSISTYLLGKTKSFKNAPGLVISLEPLLSIE